MAVMLEGGCRVSDMREGDPLTEGTVRVWKQIGRASGAQAISLRVMQFAPGLSPGIRNDLCDEILFVLNGFSGRSFAGGDQGSTNRGSRWVKFSINGQSHEVGPDSGIYIRPGETFAVDNPGPDPIIIISSQCPDPERSVKFVSSPAASNPMANTAARIVRLADRRAQPTADRSYRVLVDDEIGSQQVTQFVGSIPPGRAPDHFHQYEEVLFILKGEGRMWAGKTNTAIAPGSCIFLPKGQMHCVENTGAGELRLLGVFYPAGSPSVRYEA